MKIILLEDIKGVGKKGQIINASDGHARNYLIPKKLGVEANASNMQALERKRKNDEAKRQEEIEIANKLAEKIDKVEVKIPVKTGEHGRLFGSVTSKEISDELFSQFNIEIDKKKISLGEPIKNLGKITVNIKIYQDVIAKLKVNVVGI